MVPQGSPAGLSTSNRLRPLASSCCTACHSGADSRMEGRLERGWMWSPMLSVSQRCTGSCCSGLSSIKPCQRPRSHTSSQSPWSTSLAWETRIWLSSRNRPAASSTRNRRPAASLTFSSLRVCCRASIWRWLREAPSPNQPSSINQAPLSPPPRSSSTVPMPMASRERKRPQLLATSTPRRWLPLACHTRAFTIRPPSSGRPGSRLNRASTMLRVPSSETMAPSRGERWAAGWVAASRPAPSTRLTAGPAAATSRAPRAVLHSRSTLATPPSRNKVMLRTSTPWARATREWPNSCRSTETNSNIAVTKPRLQSTALLIGSLRVRL